MNKKDRLARFKGMAIKVFSEEDFDDPVKESVILSPIPNILKFDKDREKLHQEKKVAILELKLLYEEPLLDKEQERHLFRQFNYFKHKVLYNLHKSNPSVKTIEKYLVKANEVKRQLAYSNIRLVMSIAKKQKEFTKCPSMDLLVELIGDGNIGLLKAIEYFDYRLGNKFSTYATWAILHGMQGGEKYRLKHSLNNMTGCEDALHKRPDLSDSEVPEEAIVVNKAVESLSDSRQRQVIIESYGLDGKPNRTLAQIGRNLGVSKERARQIRERGLSALKYKLADFAEAQ